MIGQDTDEGARRRGWRFCIAPMMDGTDRHCRYFHRLLTGQARLYSEMIVAEAAVRGDREQLLGLDPIEHPVALQLGGSDPAGLAEAARVGAAYGYDEINLNVGCPSDRVQSGKFGACLMKEPALVADCVGSMRGSAGIPVTVKCRIGVDDQNPEESLFALVDQAAAAGCEVFIVHARKAWLDGLSPRENRDIPPLDYALVRRLKVERPRLTIVLNGGIGSIDAAASHLECFDGVMLGRAAYGEPGILLDVDRKIFGGRAPPPAIDDIVRQMSDYVKRGAAQDVSPHHVVRHMLGLFHGRPGARQWRRMLSEKGAKTPPDILDRALDALRSAALEPA